MHPSEAIRGTKSSLLHGRKIVVGVSGSIAAVEVVKVIRELIRHGATVTAVTTPGASRIITPEALEFATGKRPVTELTGRVEHVEHLAEGEGKADLLLLAPATANTISKITLGIDDTPVTTFASMALGRGTPIIVAPAMHGAMSKNPFVVANLKSLTKVGVDIIPPLEEEGEAKLPTPEIIVAHVLHRLASGAWKGKRVLVIGGSTAEPIDEVRSITNEGSGRFAVELAANAYYRGAEVTLWMGERRVPIPPFLRPTNFRTVAELARLVGGHASVLRQSSVVLVPAALSDFTVRRAAKGKIDSRAAKNLSLTLVQADKVLPKIRRLAKPPCRVIGFKLTAGDSEGQLLARAEALMESGGLDAVVANQVVSMGGDSTEVTLVRSRGKPKRLSGSKATVAGELLDALAGDLR